VKVKEYFKREYVGPVLRFLMRIMTVVAAVLLLDIVGSVIFLFYRGQLTSAALTDLLTILLLLEGSVIGAAGGFIFYGYSEYAIARQGGINPAIAREQLQQWKERRLSQQAWGVAMVIAGLLLILLGLLAGSLTSL